MSDIEELLNSEEVCEEEEYIPLVRSIEQLNELLAKHNVTLKRIPRNQIIQRNDRISFAKNDNPNLVYRARLVDILTGNEDEYKRDEHYRLPADELTKTTAKRLNAYEQQRLRAEEKLRQSMLSEECTLTSRYETHKSPVHYTYKGYDYSVTPARWTAGIRPHKAKCIRYTHEHIKQLFADEGCELITIYHNQKQPLQYKYNDKLYTVCFNDWKFFHSRPHKK